MEWVETTGRTVEEAKDAALDRLGVDEQDAEFEVVEEARTGLFGRLRSEARVRARVRPATPRPKLDRRDRRRGGRGQGRDVTSATGSAEPETGTRSPAGAVTTAETERPRAAPRRRGGRGGGRSGGPGRDEVATRGDEGEEAEMGDQATLEEQGQAAEGFLDGLVEAFGRTATTAVQVDEDDGAVAVSVRGHDLGLLIGPRGQTLQAVQELCRTVVQRRAAGAAGRVRIDIGGYRERRREALERFSRQVAEQVLRTGTAKALEPMNAADRKTVHDTVNEIDGVETASEGEDPHRRVVVLPASSSPS